MKRIIVPMLLMSNLLFAQGNYQSYLTDKTAYREHPLDITKMKVEVSFEPIEGKVKGKVTHSFRVIQQRVDSVFFDGPGIAISSATLNGEKLPYSTNKTGVWVKPAKSITWDQNGTIVFEYEATPKKGIYFIGWKDTVDLDSKNPFSVRKQIWTQGQGVDNRYWIPMYDDMNDKFITETLITFDKEYQVLSNGTLLKKSDNKNTTTWNYTMTKPHAGYLLMIAIGKYAVMNSKSASGVPLNNWYYPEFKERAEPTYRYTADMMNFLEKETGVKYPWESYSQVMVQGFIYGAMENTTATIFGDFFNVDERAFPDRAYVGVNCHEMTHQWFGDFITARDSRDAWMQESFATYWPKQFAKVNDGIDEWSWQRRGHQNAAIEAGKKDSYPVRHTMGGTARNYPKGAAVISMMEYVLGDDQWKRALNHYLTTHAYANVEANDLKQAIQDQLGKDLSWFFDEWILRGGEPHYKVRYNPFTYPDGSSKGTEVIVEQIHKTDETVKLFTMPVWIEVHYTDGTTDKVQEIIDENLEIITIPNWNGRKIAYVLFDPNSNIIKQLTFIKPFEELKMQATQAEHMLDRYDAVVAMKELPIEQKRETLLQVLSKEKHYGIRNEVVNQLINDADQASISAMQNLLQDASAKSNTRETIVRGLKTLSPSWKDLVVKSLTDNSYEVVKAAMDKLVQLSFDEPTVKMILEKTNEVYGMNNAVAIKREELKVLAGRSLDSFKGGLNGAETMINRYGSYRYEFRTRILAFNALKTLNTCNEEVVYNLFQAMLSSNGRLAGPASQTVEYFAGQAVYKQMMVSCFNKQHFSAEERESLKKQLNFL